MKTLGIFVFAFLILMPNKAKTQSSSEPEPIMSKLILKEFINLHFEYPEACLQKKTEGIVLIRFRTNKEGKVIESHVERSVSEEIDRSALHLFSMILWKPALNYGIPIDGNGDFELEFNCKKFEKLAKSRGYRHISLPYQPVDTLNTIYVSQQLAVPPEIMLDSSFSTLNDFIYHHLHYPEPAEKLRLSGTVRIRFIIEPDGLPSNIEVIEPVGGGCSEEAVRIIEMTKWMPGIREEIAVRTKHEMFIKFIPPEEGEGKYIPSQSNTGL